MTLLIGFLSFILVVNCLFLVLLVLVQLPKKEAGAGVAFGGGATDALFGAGTGNVLTKLTKYAAALFLSLGLILSVLNAKQAGSGTRSLERELQKKSQQLPPGGVPLEPVTASTPAATSSVPTLMSTTNPAPVPIPAQPAPAPKNPGTP